MRITLALVIFATILAPKLAIAAKPTWQSEPSTVFGIALGEPISSKIPDCAPVDYRNYRPHESFCKETSPYPTNDVVLVEFKKIPMGNILSTITAFTYEGIVGSLHASAPHGNYSQFREALIEKYGQPTKILKETVRTNAGVDWPSEVLRWTGINVSIELHERMERVTVTTMVVSHTPTLKSHDNYRKNAAKSAASEL